VSVTYWSNERDGCFSLKNNKTAKISQPNFIDEEKKKQISLIKWKIQKLISTEERWIENRNLKNRCRFMKCKNNYRFVFMKMEKGKIAPDLYSSSSQFFCHAVASPASFRQVSDIVAWVSRRCNFFSEIENGLFCVL
jgi:hypothetical protein